VFKHRRGHFLFSSATEPKGSVALQVEKSIGIRLFSVPCAVSREPLGPAVSPQEGARGGTEPGAYENSVAKFLAKMELFPWSVVRVPSRQQFDPGRERQTDKGRPKTRDKQLPGHPPRPDEEDDRRRAGNTHPPRGRRRDDGRDPQLGRTGPGGEDRRPRSGVGRGS
jgi:hypothetical protein